MLVGCAGGVKARREGFCFNEINGINGISIEVASMQCSCLIQIWIISVGFRTL